jgi:signal transduction histidine kinase
MKTLGIHARLLLTVFIIISVASLTLGIFGVNLFNDFAGKRFDERFQSLAKYLALNAELGVLIDQRSMLDQLARNLLAGSDVARVSIYNRANETLARAEKNISGPFHMVSEPVRMGASSEESQAFSSTGFASEKNDADDIIGSVEIVYTTAEISALLETIAVRFIIFTVGLTGLCLLVFFFISRSLVAPLTRLAFTARKVGAGERELRMTPGSIPETREVSLAFNAMLDSLEKSRKAVEEANREMARQNLLAEMGKFSMMIAHEIKNPLGIIKSSFDILKKDPSADSNRMLIGYIEEEIQRINGLIEDFLLFAKPAKPSFRIIDANHMLKESLDRFGRLKAAEYMEIRRNIPEESCLSYLDPDLCRRAIDNIMKNAMEACQGKGVICIDAVGTDETWRLEISDNGDGIPPDVIGKIFDPFFTTRAKGTGLGLAYTAQVVSAHGGKITASNMPAGGALFCIEIPREPVD